jgi:hypothetical protein
MQKQEKTREEAYTDFLSYCSQKENMDIATIADTFRDNGVEEEFKKLYYSGALAHNYQYYRKIKKMQRNLK